MITQTRHFFYLKNAHRSWHNWINEGLSHMDKHYLDLLAAQQEWLPGPEKIFNAFSIPVESVKTVLLGESPYPRKESANGYAFWDENVNELWSNTGLSKKVNRATSLRNIVKMLLICEKLLKPESTGQNDIASLDKSLLIQTNQELFNNLLSHGFLLLNASLVLQTTPVQQDALKWQPFIKHILERLVEKKPEVRFLLLGKIANNINKIISSPHAAKYYAEHPYNLSFITNKEIIAFFKPMHLLLKN